jgi:hypothetical protein
MNQKPARTNTLLIPFFKKPIMSQIDNNDPKRSAILPAAKTALDSTCQLYQWIDKDSEKFTANGCTILFQHNRQYYCFSNAHVLAGLQLGKTFFILRDKLTMTVGGYMYHSMPLSSLDPKDDYLDVAVVKLTDNTAKHLLENGCKFLTLEDVKIVPALSSVDILLLAGHPASKMKIDPKTQSLKFNPFIGRTIPYLRKIKSLLDLFLRMISFFNKPNCFLNGLPNLIDQKVGKVLVGIHVRQIFKVSRQFFVAHRGIFLFSYWL